MGSNGIERRQFGRRPSNIKAYAVLPGQIQVPCIIENLSDGGALLYFTEGAAPTQSFRLAVDGTSFNLLCEARHRSGRKIGIRFVRLAEGIALNRHCLKTATEPAGIEFQVQPAVGSRPASGCSVRDLRRMVLAFWAKSAGDKAEAVPAHVATVAGSDTPAAACSAPLVANVAHVGVTMPAVPAEIVASAAPSAPAPCDAAAA